MPRTGLGGFWGSRTYLGLHNSNTVVCGLETALETEEGNKSLLPLLTRGVSAPDSSRQRVLNGTKAAASRTGKKRSHWKRPRQSPRGERRGKLSGKRDVLSSPARPPRGAGRKKRPPKALPAPGRRRRRRRRGEKKRERGGGEFAGVSGGEKTPAVPECPTGLAEGRQRQEPGAGQRHRPPSATR